MGARGNAESADDAAPGPWGSFGAALRLMVGWLSVAIAILNLATELDHLPAPSYLLFHAVLLVGGLLLISHGRGAGPAGYLAAGAVLVGGLVVSALPVNHTVCCTTFAVRHGYPFTLVARNAGGGWHVDGRHLLADLLFWGYAGLIVLVLVSMARRVVQHHGGGDG